LLMADSVMKKRAELEAQASEGGVGMGIGTIFNRPSPADLLKASLAAGGGKSKAAPKAPPKPAPEVVDPPAPAEPGQVLHQGTLRKKKEDHGRFEDPYKTICVCRIQDGALRVRATQNAELVGEEEQYDLKQWQLLERNDKPDRFSLTRGVMMMPGGADQPSVVTFKADNKSEAAAWKGALKQGADSRPKAGAVAGMVKQMSSSKNAPAPKPSIGSTITEPKANATPAPKVLQTAPARPSPPREDSNLGSKPEESHAPPQSATMEQLRNRQVDPLAPLQAPESASMQLLHQRQSANPSSHLAPGAPESSSMDQLRNRQMAPESATMDILKDRQAAPPASSTMNELMDRQVGPSGQAPPESNSMAQLQARQAPEPPAAAAAATPVSPRGPPAGVGLVFKESRRNSTTALVVKSLAPGGPAEASGKIQVGDILLKVDGKEVNSIEKAGQLLLGEKGSTITMQFKRFTQDKVEKITVSMKRGALN